MQLAHLALWIVQVAKHNRLRGTRLLTRGDNGAIWNGEVGRARACAASFDPLILVLNLGRRDALHAERTFLHDAAHAHGDFWIKLHSHQDVWTSLNVIFRLDRERATLLAHGFAPLIIKEVETTHFIWTIVAAIARANAAVVHHAVDAVGVMHGCGNGTHLLARRIFTVHARHWLNSESIGLGGIGSAEISIDANPEHFAAALDLVLAHDWNIIFRLARRDARAATSACGEIHRHGPAELRAVQIIFLPQ